MLIIRYLTAIAFLLLTNSPTLMAAPFLYSANSNGTVSVVDEESNGVTATIALNSKPTKICLNPLTPTAYILNTDSLNPEYNTISVINTSTNTLTTTIADDRFTYLYALACSPDGTRVYVTNQKELTDPSYLYIIDATNNTVLADAIPVGSNPAEMILNADGSKAYVLNSAVNTLTIIDTITKEVVNTLSLSENSFQLSLAMHTNDAYLYILNAADDDFLSGTLEIRDPDNGNILKSIVLGGMPYRVKVNHISNLLYITDFDGLKSVDPETYVVTTLDSTVYDYILSLELNSDASKLFVAIDGFDSISVYNTQFFSDPPETILLPKYPDETSEIDVSPNSLAALHGSRHQLTINASGNGTGTVSWPINLNYSDTNTGSIMVPENISVSIKAEAAQNSFILWTGCDSVTGNGTSIAVCTINPLTSDKAVNAIFSWPATLISPTMPYTFTGASQTFTWTNTGASLYQLGVGTTLGAADLGGWPVGGTTATSTTVTGLPTNGSTIYVRLWSLSGSTWSYVDYSYAASGTSTPATMISPANATKLASASQTFTWTNSGASLYQLGVGTTLGAGDLGGWPVGGTTATSTTVTGLPTDGSTIYVRLWSLSGSTWSYVDYSYVASGASTPATMISPVGSTVGTSQLFTWTNTGASLYQLGVGTTFGASDLGGWPVGGTTATSTTVTGLPANGSTIYVRLWSLSGSTWSYNDYTFTSGS